MKYRYRARRSLIDTDGRYVYADQELVTVRKPEEVSRHFELVDKISEKDQRASQEAAVKAQEESSGTAGFWK